ncbi:hypothetical protein ACVWZL_009193 [Bradyrhizobium sp. GM2.4]
MANHLYRLRMGACAETLFRRSKRDLKQRLWLQCNVMQSGCDLGQSKHRPSAAEPPIRSGRDTKKPESRIGRTGICRNV